MADLRLSLRLRHGLVFCALAGVVMLVKLLPLGAGARSLPAPDLLVCLVLAWVVRRPDLLPVLLIAAVFFLADMMLMRPPGLWAGLVVLASEWLRRRQRPLRAMPVLLECALIGGVLTAMALAYWGVLALLFVEQPRLGQHLLHVPVTLAAYPLVAGLLHYGLGIRKRPAIEGFGAAAARA